MNIIDYIPYGKENAVSRKQLCTITGLPDRLMRREIERARKDYVILNIDGSGYFQPTDKEKLLVERWLRQERSRSKSIDTSTRGAEMFLAGDFGGKMIAVHGYTRRRHKDAEPIRQIDGQMRW